MMKFVAIKKYKGGGEATIEYFNTRGECLDWIADQEQPTDDTWEWCIGEY
jgi:hypothetical protein